MVSDFFIRTEDIPLSDIAQYFVSTDRDKKIIESLKSKTPVIVVGSRGSGKSFLLRMAEYELIHHSKERILPVYILLAASPLLQTVNHHQFRSWILAKIIERILRELRKKGEIARIPYSVSILNKESDESQITVIEKIAREFEESYKNPKVEIDVSELPTVEDLRDAIEDLCTSLGYKRIALFFDEAAHVFIREHQRQFFTLFRDLRSPYITCNAAVYPGVTAYGDTFQPSHDALKLIVERDIKSEEFVHNMRDIVTKQTTDKGLLSSINQNGENFALLAYASGGNPRVLLRTLTEAGDLRSKNVDRVIREYYRTHVWSEHSDLSEKYSGHSQLIEWGRDFIEQEVLPTMQQRNSFYLSKPDKQSIHYFWIHRDAPEGAKEALRLLAYTGIVSEDSTGIKSRKKSVGTRYNVNLGCLFALEQNPTNTALDIVKNLNYRPKLEYEANSTTFDEIRDVSIMIEDESSELLKTHLQKSIDLLDVTPWQKSKLEELDFQTIGEVLEAPESKFKEAFMIGDVRARQIKNSAQMAVFEYLSG